GTLVAAFVSTCSATVFCWGPVPAAHIDRTRDVAYVQRLVERGAELGGGNIIAVASWLPKIQVSGGEIAGSARFVYTVDSALADTIQRESQRLWYIQHAPEYNRLVTGVDLDSIGGAPLALD
ncbi:MAG TPA: hypothetical protein VLB27_09700, partial [candidate division Zixibacteria bacterium]|nr:hypothetical protein [candidate division Zixibacteria bacterium]